MAHRGRDHSSERGRAAKRSRPNLDARSYKKGSTTQIAALVSYDAATDTATLDPTTTLKRGATYKAVVITVAKDEAGNRLDQDGSRVSLQQKVWFFEIDN